MLSSSLGPSLQACITSLKSPLWALGIEKLNLEHLLMFGRYIELCSLMLSNTLCKRGFQDDVRVQRFLNSPEVP